MIDLTPFTDSNGDIDLKKELIQKLAGIVTIGSNENGKYMKFEDGTMICFGNNRKSFTSTNISLNQVNWTYPHQFVETPAIHYTTTSFALANYDNNNLFKLGNFVVQSSNQTSAVIMLFVSAGNAGFVAGDQVTLNLMAIGRWK